MANSVIINPKLCKKCGICVSACPKKVLEIEPGKPVAAVRIEDCIGCRTCELKCPDFAIEVEVNK